MAFDSRITMKVLVGVALLLQCCVNHSTVVTVELCPLATDGLLDAALEESITLTCFTKSKDSSSQRELLWFRNGQRVNLAEENRMSPSSICVDPVTKDDNGAVFSCQLKGDASLNGSVELNVQCKYSDDPPELNDTREVSVEETNDVKLSCDVLANPPVAVVWKKDGKILDLTSGSYTSTNDGITAQLKISKAKHGVHQGTYACETNSKVYGMLSRTFQVTVKDRVIGFPLGPTIAGVVVVAATIVLALISRWERIAKVSQHLYCFKRN
ncbi:hypothetical protein DNTS_008901 [Danionella cerebrum]|uniref:Ig-like domain-containing protein n=1 Tax=Danionella cerebrum TaxID=2873325 RepID=A0A553MVX3_9TELE|nr:hypothetical protein DNTS_008901 [Danionella translucida]